MARLNIKSGGKAILYFWAAIMLIIACAVGLNTLFAHAEETTGETVSAHSADAKQGNSIPNEPSEDPNDNLALTLPEDWNILIYDGGTEMPNDAVSAHHAIATASQLAQQNYQKEFTGRVFCLLGRQTNIAEGEDPNPNLQWSITAEVEGGQVSITIDSITGKETSGAYYEGETDFSWFDTWTEDKVERLGPETA